MCRLILVFLGENTEYRRFVIFREYVLIVKLQDVLVSNDVLKVVDFIIDTTPFNL